MSHLKVGPALWSCCSGREVATFGSEKEERFHHRHHGGLHHTMSCCLAPAMSWPQQHLQKPIPFGHPSAQGPCASVWHVPSRRCAQIKDHEPSPQELRNLLGRWPHASDRHAASQEMHNSGQMMGQQEVSTVAGMDLETPSPRRHLCLIKQAHPVDHSHSCADHSWRMSLQAYTTALCAMHQEQTGPVEFAALAGTHYRWLPGAHRPQVRSGDWWTSATATCTCRPMARTSRPWKPMLPRVWSLPWVPWTCCSTPSSDKWTWWWMMPWWPQGETLTPTWRRSSAMDTMPMRPG